MGVMRVNITNATYVLLPDLPITRNPNETLHIESVTELPIVIIALLLIAIFLVCIFESYTFVKRCKQTLQT